MGSSLRIREPIGLYARILHHHIYAFLLGGFSASKNWISRLNKNRSYQQNYKSVSRFQWKYQRYSCRLYRPGTTLIMIGSSTVYCPTSIACLHAKFCTVFPHPFVWSLRSGTALFLVVLIHGLPGVQWPLRSPCVTVNTVTDIHISFRSVILLRSNNWLDYNKHQFMHSFRKIPHAPWFAAAVDPSLFGGRREAGAKKFQVSWVGLTWAHLGWGLSAPKNCHSGMSANI